MNKRQFISKLQKELNAIFGPECEVVVTQDKDGTIEVGFWRNELLGFYTIENVTHNEECLQKQIGIAKIVNRGFILGRILERKIMIDELKNILTANNEEAKE